MIVREVYFKRLLHENGQYGPVTEAYGLKNLGK